MSNLWLTISCCTFLSLLSEENWFSCVRDVTVALLTCARASATICLGSLVVVRWLVLLLLFLVPEHDLDCLAHYSLCNGALICCLDSVLLWHALALVWIDLNRGRRCFIASDFVIVVDLLLLYTFFFFSIAYYGFVRARAHEAHTQPNHSVRAYSYLTIVSLYSRCISWEYCNLSERALALDFAI